MRKMTSLLAVAWALAYGPGTGYGFDFSNLPTLTPGRVQAENGLWIETPKERQFHSSKQVVVADVKGPGVITMIHFALPALSVAKPDEYRLGRELLLRMYWDGEQEPSVDCPLVDFFCDPAGMREQVNTALVNKRRGFNTYFPMPFRKSARVVLVYEGDEKPGDKLWSMMPCYSYVMWRSANKIPQDEGYFHAQWRQQGVLMGKEDYLALEARGEGKFVGWNVTVRRPGTSGYPVDMNEKFYIDGEKTASVEFQGIEDSFGFSWGFPPTESVFPLTGYWPFMLGAMAYRFFVDDAISFDKTLRVAIGFGENEDPSFRKTFSQHGTTLQLSSTCYWYQAEPHAAFPPMLPLADRAPAPEQLLWPEQEQLPTAESLRGRGVTLYMLCGRPEKEVIFAEPGFGAAARKGYAFGGWPPPVYHCRADDKETMIELTTPKGATGTLRIYVIDPDQFVGGRRQKVFAADRDLGEVAQFQDGKWLEMKVTADMTADGKLPVRAVNSLDHSNAVLSIIEWAK